MFSSARKAVNRIGLTNHKVLFTIEIKTIMVPSILSKNAIMSICFERGGKISSSKNHQILASQENVTINVNETLQLMATLYREKNGRFQKKQGKIVLRELVQSKLGGSTYQGLGLCTINLNEFVPDDANSTMTKDITLTPESLGRGIIITIRISAKFFASNDDDANSILSGYSEYSEKSTLAANFDANINSLLFTSNETPKKKTITTTPLRQPMIKEGEDEKAESYEQIKAVGKLSENENIDKIVVEEDGKGIVEKYPNLSKKFLGLDSITDETNELITDLRNQIIILKKELSLKDGVIKAIELEDEKKLEKCKATILSLRKELYVSQQALQQEKTLQLSSLNKETNSRSDMTLSTALAMAREETAAVAQEYAQACAECR